MTVLRKRSKLQSFIDKLSIFMPFTYSTIISRSLKDSKTVLDIGCGKGELMKKIRREQTYCVGLDIHLPYLKEAKRNKSHDDFISADARRIPIRPRSFDAVLCSQLIEHLKKHEGLKIVDEIETMALSKVVLATTVGYIPYLPLDEDQDELLQVHKSGYTRAV